MIYFDKKPWSLYIHYCLKVYGQNVRKSLVLTKALFIWTKYSKLSNIVK